MGLEVLRRMLPLPGEEEGNGLREHTPRVPFW